MIKRILVATSLLCMCCILFAQNVQVKGKVVSENEAVEFANVVLQTKDSIFIAGGVTGLNTDNTGFTYSINILLIRI